MNIVRKACEIPVRNRTEVLVVEPGRPVSARRFRPRGPGRR
ncbi:MAG: hypothetical protein V8T86_06510 [Victivallis sp.]